MWWIYWTHGFSEWTRLCNSNFGTLSPVALIQVLDMQTCRHLLSRIYMLMCFKKRKKNLIFPFVDMMHFTFRCLSCVSIHPMYVPAKYGKDCNIQFVFLKSPGMACFWTLIFLHFFLQHLDCWSSILVA